MHSAFSALSTEPYLFEVETALAIRINRPQRLSCFIIGICFDPLKIRQIVHLDTTTIAVKKQHARAPSHSSSCNHELDDPTTASLSSGPKQPVHHSCLCHFGLSPPGQTLEVQTCREDQGRLGLWARKAAPIQHDRRRCLQNFVAASGTRIPRCVSQGSCCSTSEGMSSPSYI